MRILEGLIRIYSLLFHLLLGLFLLGISVVSLASGQPLKLEVLPVQTSVAAWVCGGAAFGLLSILLAVAKRLRALFVLWTLIVVILLLRAILFSPFRFEGTSGLTWWLAFLAAAVLALLGGIAQWRAPVERR